MSERTKRILIIIGFVAFSLVMGFAIYWVFFRPTPSAVPVPGEGLPTSGLPSAGTGAPSVENPLGAGALPPGEVVPGVPTQEVPTEAAAPSRTAVLTQTFTQAVSRSVGKDGVRMYNPDDGKFYKVLADGTLIPLSDQTFYGVQDVTWGNASDKAVMVYPDGSKTMYDFTKDKQYTLPKHWEDFSFSTQDDKIAAKSLGNNENARFLVVSNPDGTEAHAVEDLGTNDDKVQVSWAPNNQVVAFSHTGESIGMDREQVLLLGQHQENFKGLIVEGRGFVPNWSPSGNNLLYSVYSSSDDYLPELWVSGAVGDQVNANRRKLNIATWADKCAWQNDSIVICAVPESLGVGAGLQREVFANNPDRIVRINLQNGQITDLGQPDGKPAVQQVVLSGDGQYLFYTDRQSGRLMRYSLIP